MHQDRTEERERRRTAKERVATLRAALGEARARRREALVDSKERCRAERIATRERHRALRLRAAHELRDKMRNERAAARAACTERRFVARRIGDDVKRTHAELVAERTYQRDLRRLAKEERARRRVEGSCGSGTTETDEQVAGSLPSDLVPLFERVKGSFRGKRRGEARRDAFLAYAETHPSEVLAANENAAAARVEELETALAQAQRDARSPNPYEARKAARVERMRGRAQRLGRVAEGARAAADTIAGQIPMGQPILLGHHSERRHRRDLDRIQRGHSKAMALRNEAETLARRADFAEANRAISSDDPDAVTKLRDKLAALDADRARMVEANKAIRSGAPREALTGQGFTKPQIEKLLTPDFVGRIGFPDYALRNASAEAARVRKRIEELEGRASRPPPPAVERSGVRIVEEENRVRVFFETKPADGVRAQLKSAGFRWAPSSGAWQRHASNAAWYEAKRILEGLPMAAVPSTPTPVAAAAEAPKLKGEGLDTTAVAKRIREEIAAAVRTGELPRASYSVRTDKYSMGSSITIAVSKLPFPVLNPDAFYVEPGASWITFDRARFQSRFSPEAQEVERKVNALVDAYHWDRSDWNSDVYNERFARDVRIQATGREYDELQAAKLRAARAETGET